MLLEEWKDVKGFERCFQVSNVGRIRSLPRMALTDKYPLRGRFLKTTITPTGYERVTFKYRGKNYNYSIHRLVAEAFIPNPENHPSINHINEIKDLNTVDNLEWCTHQYNSEYSIAKYFYFISPEGEKTKVFNLAKFCRENSLNSSHMNEVHVNKRRKSCKGWTKWNRFGVQT